MSADLRLLGPAVAAWVGLAALLGASDRVLVGTAVGSVLLASAAVIYDRTRGSRLERAWVIGVGLCAVALAMVLVAATLHRSVRGVGTVTELAEQGATVTVVATVASDPVLLPANGVRRTPLVLVRLQVHEVEGRGRRSDVNTPVLAFGDRTWRGLEWGEQVRAVGRLAPARPGDDVLATMSGKGRPTSRAPPDRLRRTAGSLRSGLQRAVAGLPGQGKGLLPGLVVGDTSGLDPRLETDMRAAGLTHLVAVSGSNVAIVCGAVLLLARRVGMPRRLRAPAAGLTLVAFVVVARPEPSVLRAAVMGGIGLVGLASARRGQGVPALSAAVVLLLVVDPWLARSYGFALSVLATLGLLLLARPWGDALCRWLPRPLAMALAVPLAAQAACGPVVVLLQGSVSVVAVPANLAAAPLVAPATLAGVLAAALSVVWGPAARLAAWPGLLAADGIAAVAHLSARAPSLPWPGGAGGALTLAALTAMCVVWGGSLLRQCIRHPWAAGMLAPAIAAGVVPIGGSGWPPPGWVMVMCDVGQGDGLVLRTAPGHAMVVDAGPDPVLMDRCLRALRVTAVDLLVLTHDHADHVEGVPGVLRGRRVGELVVNGLDDPAGEARRIASWAARARVPIRAATVGQTGQVAGVTWQVLWPRYVIHEGSVPNNASVVLWVHAGGLRLLLLGDVETPAARQVDLALRALPEGPSVDVIKVAHHGSALQDPGLVRDAGAALALVSVGAGNSYGHPARSTLDLLAGTGATVRRTDRDGDIAVLSHGGRISVVTHPP